MASSFKIKSATASLLEDEEDSADIARYLTEQESETNMSDSELLKVMGFSLKDLIEIKEGEKGRR